MCFMIQLGIEQDLFSIGDGFSQFCEDVKYLAGVLWGPRLISRDHRMHVYNDPRDQCSLNKLNNKSLTSIHTVLHK